MYFELHLAKEIFWYISSNIFHKNYPNLQLLLLLAMLMEEPVQPDWRNRRQILLTLFTQAIPAQTLTSEVCVCTKKGRSCSLVIFSTQIVIFSTQIETLVCVGGGRKLHPPGNARSLSQQRLYKYQRQYRKSSFKGAGLGPRQAGKVSAHIKGAL